MVDGRGNAYVNNIGFDFPAGRVRARLIALVTPDGTVRQVADDLAFPNGMAVTPDGSTLIVAESYAARSPPTTSRPTAACRTAACGPSSARISAGRHLRRRRGRGLVRQRPQQALRPRPRRRRGAGDDRADRGCFACMLGGPDGRSLFAVAAAWPEAMGGAARTGQVLVAEVEVPAPAGRGEVFTDP